MPQRQNMLQFRTLDRAQVGYRSMRLLTSFEVSIAGKELSKPSICWPPTLAWLKSPPSRSSSPSSTVASLSFSEANWSASSPRRARSRERKSSVSFESPTRSKSVDGPRACVWPGNVQYALRSCFGGPIAGLPASISSREGNRSAILNMRCVRRVQEKEKWEGSNWLRASCVLLR
jgi:hypothetical protein